MKYNYDLSIIVPGIRNEHWNTLWEHATYACKRYSFEMIFSGPVVLPEELRKNTRVKYIKNSGTPSRALHLGSLIAEGRFMTFLSDDAHLYPDSIDKCVDLLLQNEPEKSIVGMRYSEGTGHSGGEPPPAYWVAGTHPDLHAPGVDRNWKIPIVMMVSLEYYRELGGIDCNFWHTNMNLHDFAFRAQMNGSQVFLSPTLVMNCDFEPNRTPENSPVIAAFYENDRPLFWKLWDQPGSRPIRIDIEGWRETPSVWDKRKVN